MARRRGPTGDDAHMASGPWPQRALKIAFERLAQKAGERVASTDVARGLYQRIVGAVPAIGTTGVFEGTNILLQIATQDLVFWRLIAKLFRLAPDQARELGNEAFDSFWGGLFDAVNRHKDIADPNEQTRALERDTDGLIDKMMGDIRHRNPALLTKVWFVRDARKLYHRENCPEVRNHASLHKDVTEHQAIQEGGRRARECAGCSDLNAEFAGTLLEALNRCDHLTASAVNRVLASDALKGQHAQIIAAGQKRRDITAAMLYAVAMAPTPELQSSMLLGIVGVERRAPGQMGLKDFIAKAQSVGMGVANTLLSPKDSPERQKLLADLKADASRVRDRVRHLRALGRSGR